MRHELSVLKIRYPKPKFKKLTLFGEMNFFKYGILKLFSSNLVTPFLVKVKKLVDLFISYNSEVKRNFDYIIGVEQFGIPRGNMIPFPFSYEENLKSQHWRSIIAVHNYPGILLASGYELVKLKVVKTNNPHPDFRLMSFIAKRVS